MLTVGLACLGVAVLAGGFALAGVAAAPVAIAWVLVVVFGALAVMALLAFGLRHLAATQFLWGLIGPEPCSAADEARQPNSSVALCGRWSLGRDSRPLPGISARSNASCSILAFRKAPQ